MKQEDKIINEQIEELKKQLPFKKEIKGSIRMKKIKCGKAKCRCSSGNPVDFHGPYPHLQWWDDKHVLRTKYLNKKNYPKFVKQLEIQNKIKTLEKLLDR